MNEEVPDGVRIGNLDWVDCMGVFARELPNGADVARKSLMGSLERGSMITGVFGCDATADVSTRASTTAGDCTRPSAIAGIFRASGTVGVFGRVSVVEDTILLLKC